MRNNKTFHLKSEMLFMGIMVAVFGIASLIYDHIFGLAMFGAGIVLLAVFYFVFVKRKIDKAKAVSQVLTEIKQKSNIDSSEDMPSVMTDSGDRIIWYNEAFSSLSGMAAEGKNIYHVMPTLLHPSKDKTVVLNGVSYTKDTFTVKESDEDYIVYRLTDTDAASRARKTYIGYISIVCYVQIDNYEEMLSDIKSNEQSTVLASIYTAINNFAMEVKGIFRQYERDKFIIVFERKYLAHVMTQKFKLLDEVREIKFGKGMSATLSIAVGAGDDPLESNVFATKALELAQGRGGNQAVVKLSDKTLFFGGAQRSVERRSRVKTRTFSLALKNLMEQCSGVFIMGHDVADLDCMGSALGLLCCARFVGKKTYIVVDKPNTSIDALISAMKGYKEYEDVLISSAEAKEIMEDTSMLIVVDTQIARYTEAPELLDRSETLVVIDHHFRGTEYIENSSLLYHEPYASSCCELVTEIVQYFDENISLLPLEAEALLAGITIDTKGFSFKTGVRTFEAASYLRRSGADTISIRQLFQDDLATYSNRVEVVRNAKILKNGIAVSRVPKGMENSALIAAQASDSLLTIRGIAASFVISMQEDVAIISGRSLGSINVQLIMEKLGGGGHVTIAGAKIKDKTMDEAQEMLLTAIEEYLKEGKES
jgi:c-di-AMP phosphodiesterase-like protein